MANSVRVARRRSDVARDRPSLFEGTVKWEIVEAERQGAMLGR
ncbi:hypothetical protein [Gemmatimonas groenlandica]|nr:hypothetical protein [Gemmatimonas groenlandica]